MTNIAISRVQREFKEVLENEQDSTCAIKVERINDTWTELRGSIAGPRGTPYEGGSFILEINIPENYPFCPPMIRFLTRVWHPNISSEAGFICLDILKDQWVASMTLRTVLLSLQALLSAAEPNDPLDAIVGQQYLDSKIMFERTAKHWTSVYAGGPHRDSEFDIKIKRLVEIGMAEDDARATLSSYDWDVQKSCDLLFK